MSDLLSKLAGKPGFRKRVTITLETNGTTSAKVELSDPKDPLTVKEMRRFQKQLELTYGKEFKLFRLKAVQEQNKLTAALVAAGNNKTQK